MRCAGVGLSRLDNVFKKICSEVEEEHVTGRGHIYITAHFCRCRACNNGSMHRRCVDHTFYTQCMYLYNRHSDPKTESYLYLRSLLKTVCLHSDVNMFEQLLPFDGQYYGVNLARPWYTDIWPNIILQVSVKVFLR